MKILLEEFRKKRKLNQAELSKMSGVPQPMISEIENEIVKNPTVGTMSKLARALRCLIDDLVQE